MKKFFSLMVACAAMFAFAACENGTDDTNNGGTNNGGNKTALATPVLKIDEAQSTSSSFVVTWDAVENAASYMVNNGSENKTITETSFKMENLNAGTYTVKVMAMAAADSNYSNSEFATITYTATGVTIDQVDWVKHAATLPTEEDAKYGYYPFVHIFDTYMGTGIKSIKNGCFNVEVYGNTPVADLIKECEALPAEYINQANTADGLTLVYELVENKSGVSYLTFGPVSGNGATYRVVSEITNEDGVVVITDETIKTGEGTVSPAIDQWTGSWTLESEYSVDGILVDAVDDEGQPVIDETTGEQVQYVDTVKGSNKVTMNLTIAPCTELSWNAVYVYGLCTADEALTTLLEEETVVPVYGLINNNVLEIYSGWTMMVFQDESALVWNGYANTELYGYIPVGGLYPAYTLGFAKSGEGENLVVDYNTVVTNSRYEGVLGDETRSKFETVSYTLMYETAKGTSFIDNFPVYYPAGDWTLTRAAAEENTPAPTAMNMPSCNANVKGYPAKHSLVVAM